VRLPQVVFLGDLSHIFDSTTIRKFTFWTGLTRSNLNWSNLGKWAGGGTKTGCV